MFFPSPPLGRRWKTLPPIFRRIWLVRPRPHTKYLRTIYPNIASSFNCSVHRTAYLVFKPRAVPDLVSHYMPLARRLIQYVYDRTSVNWIHCGSNRHRCRLCRTPHRSILRTPCAGLSVCPTLRGTEHCAPWPRRSRRRFGGGVRRMFGGEVSVIIGSFYRGTSGIILRRSYVISRRGTWDFLKIC